MGKSTISMAIFNSYVKLPEGMVFPLNMVFSCNFFPWTNPLTMDNTMIPWDDPGSSQQQNPPKLG